MPVKTRVFLSMLLALSIESQATVSFLIQADLLTDRNGVPIPNDAMVLLVASTTDSTFGYPWTSSYIPAQVGARLQPDGDDYIVYRTHIDTAAHGFGPGVLDVATRGLHLESIPNWNPGDPLMLMWFPTLNSS